jgi:hypothetical protein
MNKKRIKMIITYWFLPITLLLAILLGFVVLILPDRKLLIIEKWIKAWKGKIATPAQKGH